MYSAILHASRGDSSKGITFQFCPEGNIKNRAGSEKCAQMN